MPGNQILTLLTDFGSSDVYVGVMKGAIAQVNPELYVVDLTHQIPPQNVLAAQFNLMNAYPYFPEGTVHVAVVDPGVGSKRRAIAIQLEGGTLVGPDNGIFSNILDLHSPIAVVELTNSTYWRTFSPSSTFHGRDIFAPVGAHLASGVSLQEVGAAIAVETLVRLPPVKWTQTERGIAGSIQYIDHFGNLVTTIPGGAVEGKLWSVWIGATKILGQQAYVDAAIGEAVALVGSHGWVEVAVNSGNAQVQLRAGWNCTVHVEFEC